MIDNNIYENDIIIIDNGSSMMKIGYSTYIKPLTYSCIIKKTKDKYIKKYGHITTVGDEKYETYLTQRQPMQHGVIEDFTSMEDIWAHGFDLLGANSLEHSVLLTEAPLNPKTNRQTMCEIMFEVFGVPSLHVAVQGVLSLYSIGKTTGLVVDMGDGITSVIPVYEGYGLVHGIRKCNLGGIDISLELQRLMAEKGYIYTTRRGFNEIRQLKEKYCYVKDVSDERLSPISLEMYDKRVVNLDSELWAAPESLLFEPNDNSDSNLSQIGYPQGLSCGLLPSLIVSSVTQSALDIRRSLTSNIVLCGGTSLLSGLKERLQSEIENVFPRIGASSSQIRVLAPENRDISVWQGGQQLAHLKQTMGIGDWISRLDFEEEGIDRIHDNMTIKYC
eukprot:GHVL01028615.1.p1 GENE.GHVL01028615.1~~GHVL01028615.1.p1  ORF type:complete len:389 (+),score=87.51 GHVL01028615.1:28-1194(+)